MLSIPSLFPVLVFLSIVARASADGLDLPCPSGFYSGVTITEGQYNVPAKEFYKRVGSFFKAEWYVSIYLHDVSRGGLCTNRRQVGTSENYTTTGTDNTIGAIREGPFGNTYFKETLVRSVQSPSEHVLAWTGIGMVYADPSGEQNITLYSYTEEHRINSICGGKATLVYMWNLHCADDYVNSWDAWDRVRSAALDAVVLKMGAKRFVGTCPGGERELQDI